MLDTFYGKRGARSRVALVEGPLGPYAEALVSALVERGYTRGYGVAVLRAAAKFGTWLLHRGCSVADVDEQLVATYRKELGRHPCGVRHNDGRCGMQRILEVLPRRATSPVALTEAECWLLEFDRHLANVAGLAATTRESYIRVVRWLIQARFGDAPLTWSALNAEDISRFVQAEATRSSSTPTLKAAISALVRYLVSRGLHPANLAGAVPRIRQWSLSSLPRYATDEEIDALLRTCRDGSPIGLRDQAILTVLYRLGLRACETVRLTLEDVNWRDGVLLVRGKSKRERPLPLLNDVGAILARYLREARPPTSRREVFLRHYAPIGPLTSVAVSTIARKRELAVGIVAPKLGSHLLRHSAATFMVRRGASFKEIADVLGHRALHTTAIYAKLDVTALARVTMPWPGGGR